MINFPHGRPKNWEEQNLAMSNMPILVVRSLSADCQEIVPLHLDNEVNTGGAPC